MALIEQYAKLNCLLTNSKAYPNPIMSTIYQQLKAFLESSNPACRSCGQTAVMLYICTSAHTSQQCLNCCPTDAYCECYPGNWIVEAIDRKGNKIEKANLEKWRDDQLKALNPDNKLDRCINNGWNNLKHRCNNWALPGSLSCEEHKMFNLEPKRCRALNENKLYSVRCDMPAYQGRTNCYIHRECSHELCSNCPRLKDHKGECLKVETIWAPNMSFGLPPLKKAFKHINNLPSLPDWVYEKTTDD